MRNKAVNETVREIRKRGLKKARTKKKASYWKEDDTLEGRLVETGVVILPTRGCGWARTSGCTMCGYVYDAGDMNDSELSSVFSEAASALKGVKYLKIFTSGSFFDRREVTDSLLQSIIQIINEMDVEQLQVESRPEYIKSDILSQAIEGLDSRLEVGIGLETSSDIVREKCINKGFTFDDYEKAVQICNSQDVFVKTYLLLKPPFMLEREAISDTVKSAKDAERAGSAKVSINPMNIQNWTLVEQLWKRREYRPPWLWSLVEVLKQLTNDGLSIPVLSHPTGGGSRRGVHNCGKCDSKVLKAIRAFSTTQEDGIVFESLDCGCKRHWKDYLLLE
jgi:radical SAM enzyme (TIGR01210 family)